MLPWTAHRMDKMLQNMKKRQVPTMLKWCILSLAVATTAFLAINYRCRMRHFEKNMFNLTVCQGALVPGCFKCLTPGLDERECFAEVRGRRPRAHSLCFPWTSVQEMMKSQTSTVVITQKDKKRNSLYFSIFLR